MVADREIIGAVGAGRMGRGIAVACAFAGHRVKLIDLKPRERPAQSALFAAAAAEIRETLGFLVQVGALGEDQVDAVAALVEFAGSEDAPATLSACDILFEAAPETLEAKRVCLEILGAHARADAVIASTTSTMDVDMLAALVRGPERFLNAHWLNPAHLMPLVELSPSGCLDPEVMTRIQSMLRGVGKTPVVCRASPGYIVPRIQALAMNEAARLVEEGVASAEDVDTAVRIGFGLRFAVLGLLEFIDWGGGDILYHASHYLAEHVDAVRFAPPVVIEDQMRGQRRGLRDGVGFYDYRAVDVAAYRGERLGAFAALLRHLELMPVHRPG